MTRRLPETDSYAYWLIAAIAELPTSTPCAWSCHLAGWRKPNNDFDTNTAAPIIEFYEGDFPDSKLFLEAPPTGTLLFWCQPSTKSDLGSMAIELHARMNLPYDFSIGTRWLNMTDPAVRRGDLVLTIDLETLQAMRDLLNGVQPERKSLWRRLFGG
jgi:hypothetical protein